MQATELALAVRAEDRRDAAGGRSRRPREQVGGGQNGRPERLQSSGPVVAEDAAGKLACARTARAESEKRSFANRHAKDQRGCTCDNNVQPALDLLSKKRGSRASLRKELEKAAGPTSDRRFKQKTRFLLFGQRVRRRLVRGAFRKQDFGKEASLTGRS